MTYGGDGLIVNLDEEGFLGGADFGLTWFKDSSVSLPKRIGVAVVIAVVVIALIIVIAVIAVNGGSKDAIIQIMQVPVVLKSACEVDPDIEDGKTWRWKKEEGKWKGGVELEAFANSSCEKNVGVFSQMPLAGNSENSQSGMGGEGRVFNCKTGMYEVHAAGMNSIPDHSNFAPAPMFHTQSRGQAQRTDRKNKVMRMYASQRRTAEATRATTGAAWLANNPTFQGYYKKYLAQDDGANSLGSDSYYEGLTLRKQY